MYMISQWHNKKDVNVKKTTCRYLRVLDVVSSTFIDVHVSRFWGYGYVDFSKISARENVPAQRFATVSHTQQSLQPFLTD